MRPRKYRTRSNSASRGESPLSPIVTRRRDCLPSNKLAQLFADCRQRLISARKSRNRHFSIFDHLSGYNSRNSRDPTPERSVENNRNVGEVLFSSESMDRMDVGVGFRMKSQLSSEAPPSGCRQLKALLWKSWLTQKRRPLWTLAELFVPLVLTAALMTVDLLVQAKQRPDTVFEPFYVFGDARDLLTRVDGIPLMTPTFTPTELYYAPRTPVTEVIMQKLLNKLNLVPAWAPANPCSQRLAEAANELQKMNYWMTPPVGVTATAYDNASALEGALFEKLKSFSPSFFAGVVFDDEFAYGRNTKQVEYTLRFPYEQRNVLPWLRQGTTVFTWSTNDYDVKDYQSIHQWPNSSDGGLPGYWREGFLTLQRAIDTVLTESIDPSTLCLMAMTNVKLTRFPFLAHIDNPLIEQFAMIMPSILVISFVLSLLYIARSLTIEKENHLVEYIEIVTGLPNWVQWMSHFLMNFIKLTFISVTMTTMLCTTTLSNSSPFLVFAFIFLFCLNVIAFGFFISAFFNGANNATLCAGVLWFLLYVPCLYAQRYYPSLDRIEKISFSLLTHGATVIGCQILAALEANGTGLNWNNVMVQSTSNDIAPLELLLLLFVDVIPLFVLAFYVDDVKSGRRRWHHIFSCIKCLCKRSTSGAAGNQVTPKSFDSGSVEKTNLDKRASLVINNVVKKYKDHNRREVRALNHFSLFVQPGELTVILGHNGAGKTTLMKILTGCQKVSSGCVFINDMDVSSEMDNIRLALSYCPQYNILFDCLTVEEHLKFYLQLKTSKAFMSNLEKTDKVNQLLRQLRLDKKKHDLARNLSGGQKRRLSLAIALVGGSRVILLDEPTSGMDPGAKGSIMDVLKRIKQPNVTLVLVTHYVDEAELLGDRIAIVADGRLRCYGTNMYLKNRFGNGYRLTISFASPDLGKRIRTEVAAQRVREVLSEMCPGACRLLKTKGNEATFLLHSLQDTVETCRRHQLVLFTLENLAEQFCIQSISLRMPSMQDVFMNCSSSNNKIDNKAAVNVDDFEEEERNIELPLTTTERNTGFSLSLQHFAASFRKRAFYSWRHKSLLFFQIMVLALSVGVGAVLNNILRRHQPQMPPLQMDSAAYGPITVPLMLSLGLGNGTSNDALAHRIADQLVQTFRNSVFVGADVEELRDETNLASWLLEHSRKESEPFTRSHVFAIDVNQESPFANFSNIRFFSLNGFFNIRGSHSLGILMNAIGNVVLKHSCPECRIKTVNYPLPQTTILYYPFGDDFITVLCFLVGMSFFCTAFAVSIVEERANGAKHLQLLTGLRLGSYWLANCCWDAVLYLIACGILILIWWLGGSLLFKESIGFAHALLLLIGYGLSVIPMTYCMSFMLRTPASAMTVLTSIHLLLGLTPTVIVAMLAHMSFEQPSLEKTEQQITNVCASLFPQFTLARALMAYYNNVIMKEQCKVMDLCEWLSESTNPYFRVAEPLEWNLPGVGRLLLTMLLQSIAFFSLLGLIEWFSLRPSRWWYSQSSSTDPTENAAFWSRRDPNAVEYFGAGPNGIGQATDAVLAIRDLSIRYNKENAANPKPAAVDKLTFRVSRGEIFGFNGENGSGKTSTYKALTGLLAPYSGSVTINGKNVRSSWRKATQNVGYCPQFDALLERLTGSEILTHFARLRGLAGYEIPRIVAGLLEALQLTRQADRLVKSYSGGNRRKISIAISLLGAPSLLLLDEPTCGVDPKARRLIWSLLRFMKVRLNAGILLTSHDMEECEALCDRMGVLVKGRFARVDTPGALAEEYGFYYVLRLTVENSGDLEDVEEAVFALLPQAQLKAKPNSCQVHFAVPKRADVTWSRLYRIVEGLISQWPLSDFSISRASLQEAFVAITRGETGPVLEERLYR